MWDLEVVVYVQVYMVHVSWDNIGVWSGSSTLVFYRLIILYIGCSNRLPSSVCDIDHVKGADLEPREAELQSERFISLTCKDFPFTTP
jgi:hypothetical protein